MPNMNPGDIADVIRATTTLGVSRVVFDTELTWYRSGKTTRGALHPADNTCVLTGRPLRRLRPEQHTFAGLAAHNACECAWTHTGSVGCYAKLLTRSAEVVNTVSSLGEQPDWDAAQLVISNRVHLERLERLYTASVFLASKVTYGRCLGRRGHGVLAAPEDVAHVASQVRDALTRLDTLCERWKNNSASTASWWAARHGVNIDDTREHAMIIVREPTADVLALMWLCATQFGIRTRTGHVDHVDWHMVCAPPCVITHMERLSPYDTQRFGVVVGDHQVDLLFELFDPGSNPRQLVDTVTAALPA